MSRYARMAVSVVCVVLSVAALNNVFADNADVLARAKQVGCASEACTLGQMERSPFAQTFDLREKSRSVTVRCARSAVFFGDYGCTKQ